MEDVGKELKRIISKRNYQEKYAEMIAEVLNDADVQAFLSAHQEELTQADVEFSLCGCHLCTNGSIVSTAKTRRNQKPSKSNGYAKRYSIGFF